MFDESEILFLDTAVNLQFITRSQRSRLIAFAEEDDLGSVTEVVVDANLMSEEEVGEAVHAIQAGVGLGAPVPAAHAGADIAGAATSASIASIIGEESAFSSSDTDKIPTTTGSVFDALEAASQQSDEFSAEEDDDDEGGPAFPLPQGANAYEEGEEVPTGDYEDPYGQGEKEVDDEDKSIAQQLAVSGSEVLSLIDDE